MNGRGMILLEFFKQRNAMAREYLILDDQDKNALTEKMNKFATEGFRVIGYSTAFIDDGMSGAVIHYALLERTKD